ncbi:hypothetical protein BT67DRAFT_98783 [Trichocladium antarcticum]|uniref:Uncharacterized protein n=1 Tax=Trichocladium antarcticum TaxID=1450529 RepID=A0AAN6ZGP2_9PEZI|nr:hypothetical protein BT67DRAFT_98783 [Trichocladium antarcticum]
MAVLVCRPSQANCHCCYTTSVRHVSVERRHHTIGDFQCYVAATKRLLRTSLGQRRDYGHHHLIPAAQLRPICPKQTPGPRGGSNRTESNPRQVAGHPPPPPAIETRLSLNGSANLGKTHTHRPAPTAQLLHPSFALTHPKTVRPGNITSNCPSHTAPSPYAAK